MRTAQLVMAALFLFAAPTAAQTTPDELDCWDPEQEARCNAARAERQRELYGLLSIEQLQRDRVGGPPRFLA